MAFYLSKRNKEILDLVADQLKNSTGDIKIKTPYPARLASILRNTSADPEYKWIKEKYLIRIGDDYVLCQVKDFPLSVVEIPDNVEYDIYTDSANLFDIVNIIMTQEPVAIKFTNPNLAAEGDIDRLTAVLELKQYTFILDNGTLTIKTK